MSRKHQIPEWAQEMKHVPPQYQGVEFWNYSGNTLNPDGKGNVDQLLENFNRVERQVSLTKPIIAGIVVGIILAIVVVVVIVVLVSGSALGESAPAAGTQTLVLTCNVFSKSTSLPLLIVGPFFSFERSLSFFDSGFNNILWFYGSNNTDEATLNGLAIKGTSPVATSTDNGNVYYTNTSSSGLPVAVNFIGLAWNTFEPSLPLDENIPCCLSSTGTLPANVNGIVGPISFGITLTGAVQDYFILATNGDVPANPCLINSASFTLSNCSFNYSGGTPSSPIRINWAIVKILPIMDLNRNVIYSNFYTVSGVGVRSQDFTIPTLVQSENHWAFFGTIQSNSDTVSQLIAIKQVDNTTIRIRVNSASTVIVGVAIFRAELSTKFT